MTNFDYLKSEPQFEVFADVAISAEKLIHIDPEASVINCRRAMEFAIKWMYSADSELHMPYQDNLVSLMHTDEFREIVQDDIWRRLDFIRRMGNTAAHSGKKVHYDQAALCLKNLFIFLDFVAYDYAKNYEKREFNSSLLEQQEEISGVPEAAAASNVPVKETAEVDLQALIAENQALKQELTGRRESRPAYVSEPLKLSEYKTRKIYIDSMLLDAGWTEGKDWINEVELPGMPNPAGVGFADYVLYDDSHRALAVIEAKKTCVDVSVGRQQAKLYADLLEKQYKRRPVVFLTNGFEIRIIDSQYPERKCAAIYSKRDLEKWFNLLTMRTSLRNIVIDKKIAGRYYQEAAVKAVCSSFDEKNKRKALLVMATGSGKTRTVIEICNVLLNRGWVKNILFLADRNALVIQAKRNFVNLLPDLSCSNLCSEKCDTQAHCIFSTYQTMINLIDDTRDEEGKIFSCGHFDLLICDEAHRSIYHKYRDIFSYFDAPLIGLTATPKDDIDKNTYYIFDLESGVPTYGYELAQAVKDGYLVDFQSVETTLKFMEQGITYDELTDEEKAAYEDTFAEEDGEVPESISPSALNTWIFNEDTIRKALHILMTEGIRIDYGEKLGKTIIFAKNHDHAEKILQVFHREYPYLPDDYAKVIDNRIKYAQSAIDEFSEPKKLPQIAISVDMLDTGIDVPEVQNLVFFKKVLSKVKFWQMIGRGTRLCPGLCDGSDKDRFYIFDFCGNFEFFRMSKGKPAADMIPLQCAVFNLEFQIAYKLQDLDYQTERLIAYRKKLVEIMSGKVKELNRENFAVRQHLQYVDTYSAAPGYRSLSYEDTMIVEDEVAPLILPDGDEISAVRFDALMYGIELAYLVGKKYFKARKDLLKKVSGIASVANIPEIQAKSELIDKILHTDYLENAGVNEFELIREELRDLMKYLPHPKVRYDTDFTDDILNSVIKDSELESDDLANYKAKAEYYIRQHQDNTAIARLKTNQPLTEEDIQDLENILWSEIGTKEDYEKEYGEKPLGEFVREIVGLDMNAAKEAFAEYLNSANLDSRQIYFVNQIVEYIVHNGMMKDLSVLQEPPFTDRGSVVEIFTDINVWMGIRKVIDQINANAAA